MAKKWRLLPAAEIVAKETYTEEEREAEYRRGYHDGFIAAVDALCDALPHKVYLRAFDFWEWGKLASWQAQKSGEYLPPCFKL